MADWTDVQDRVERVVNLIADEGTTRQATDLTRLLYLRPSAFSYCPLNTFLGLKAALRRQRVMGFSGAFFTKVGTACHDAWQESTLSLFGQACNQHKVIVLRDWLCRGDGCTARYELTVAPPATCDHCGGASFRTAEHQVRRPGLRGHVDEIFVFEDTKTAVIFDWKSCSASKLAKKKLGVDIAYEAQISTYASLLKKRLKGMGYDVAGWCLGYFTRDNPHKRKLVFGTRLMDLATLKLWRDQHQFVLNLTTEDEVIQLVNDRPCRTREYAEANHSYCPHKGHCTYSDELALEHALDVHHSLNADGKLPAIEFIKQRVREDASSKP